MNNPSLKDQVISSIKDLQEAYQYLNENGLLNMKQTDIDTRKAQLSILTKLLNQGKPISPTQIPPPITPEYIYCTSTAERNSQFEAVISFLSNRAKAFKEKAREILIQNMNDKLKSISLSRPLLEGKKVYEFLVDKYKEAYANEWTPAPIIRKIEETKTIVDTSFIPHYAINILIQGTFQFKKNSLLFFIELPNKQKIVKAVNVDPNGNINYKETIKLTIQQVNKNELVPMGFIIFKQESNNTRKQLAFGKCELFVKNSTRSYVEVHTEFKSYEKGNKPFGEKVIVSYQVDKQETKYITNTYTVYKILKVYQPMRGSIKLYDTPEKISSNQQIVSYIVNQYKGTNSSTEKHSQRTIQPSPIPINNVTQKNEIKTINEPVTASVSDNNEQQQEETNNDIDNIENDIQAQRQLQIKEQFDKEIDLLELDVGLAKLEKELEIDNEEFNEFYQDGFSEELLNDPDIPQSYETLKLSEWRINQYEKNKQGDKCPTDIEQNIAVLNVLKNGIEEGIKSGKFTNKDFIQFTQKVLDFNKQLYKYFKYKNEEHKSTIVKDKILILLEELDSLSNSE